MIVYFVNHCRHIVILRIDDGEPIIVQPYEKASLTREGSDTIRISVRRSCDSFITKQLFKGKMYHLLIESEYTFANVSDGEVFNITREKMQISLNTFYDRLFLTAENALHLSETHKIVADEKIKKAFNKSWLIDMLFISPLETLTGGFVLWIVLGIGLTLLWGWKIAVIYFPVAYLFLVAVNWLIEKFWRTIEKKAFRIEDSKEEFFRFFDNEFIISYYADPKRAPYMGAVEIN